MSAHQGSARAERARASRLVPPDWVFLVAWPLLKVGAVRADIRVARMPRDSPLRHPLIWLRLADWLLFGLFPRLAPRSDSVAVVIALTGGQAVATGEAMRRGRRDPMITRPLAPQLCWLVYATVVPLLASKPEGRTPNLTA